MAHERFRDLIELAEGNHDRSADRGIGTEHDFAHVISSAKGVANHVPNRALSCKPCNSEHKREYDWEESLREKWKADPAKLSALRN